MWCVRTYHVCAIRGGGVLEHYSNRTAVSLRTRAKLERSSCHVGDTWRHEWLNLRRRLLWIAWAIAGLRCVVRAWCVRTFCRNGCDECLAGTVMPKVRAACVHMHAHICWESKHLVVGRRRRVLLGLAYHMCCAWRCGSDGQWAPEFTASALQ